ncbi:MAG TPA: undecaprenyldiphospho-muramoylpentapeptide beta-N-acetylglucosaminyltransferase [Pyrinomonadaceae bacterium]|jgi:UDP-N-acetylglucosamine--N-acetylmuramyl-(pentapeptide) pyrophosphoryl-undecaprenol N-acetylglucosamine transferase
MRVMFAAGGTGGHIYPAIAVAKEVMRRDPTAVVRFIGTAGKMETRLVPQAGFELSLIESAGLVNVGLGARLRSLWLIPKGMQSARRLIREFKPDAVVGAGGYVSGPVLLTAALLRVPTLVMESNAVPGFTNRMLARFVDRAATSFDAALPYFGGKGVVTGNPIRREFFDIPPQTRDAESFSLLVFGGSLGARAINEAMLAALPHLESQRKVLSITHQTGELDFEKVVQGYKLAGWEERAEVRKYIDDMVAAFAGASLIISRAGATTSAELMAAGRTAIMIPLPGQLEQRKNAEALQEAGAARMILQDELTGERLAREIVSLASAPEALTQMAEASRKLARSDAAAATVNLIEGLIRNSNQPSAKTEAEN